MGRKRRLKPRDQTVYHHVVTRTAQQQYWLEDPEIKNVIIDLIEFHSQVYYVDVLAYAIMDNHYHLCLAVNRPNLDPADIKRRYEIAQSRLACPKPFDEDEVASLYEKYTDLSRFMWHINRSTSISHNDKKETKGTMWGERFWNTVVEEGQCLLNTLVYIEMNPVRANIVADPAAFAFCSAGRMKASLALGRQPEAPVLELMMGTLPVEARAPAYLRMMLSIARAVGDPTLKTPMLPMTTTDRGRQINMKAVFEALENKAPGGQSQLIYGSEEFIKETLTSVGWLIPLPRTKKAARDGPSSRVA